MERIERKIRDKSKMILFNLSAADKQGRKCEGVCVLKSQCGNSKYHPDVFILPDNSQIFFS